ncbi:hypothetical protein PaeBR_09660 [Paenibacillus sp. BR2-3]|uniref:hypothetical protein n=1 Tax=Paenibacillus sp. BR2-3 TaxID=3048494 RepID=UPI0039776764
MENQAQRAKELFTYYYGSSFDMHREGTYEEYKSFCVSKETEMEWFKELIGEYTGQLSIRNWDAITSLSSISRNYQDSVIVENVVSFASRNIMSADSIVRLLFAERLVEILGANKKVLSKDLLFRACKVTVEVLEAIISQPLVIDPGHELQQLNLKDKRSLNSRAKKSIEDVMDIVN